MTANRGRPDVRLLAELDAGLLDEATAREVRAAAEADPAARAVLDALAATRAELAALPDPSVPPALAERWSTALAAEQSRLATTADAVPTDPSAAATSAADPGATAPTAAPPTAAPPTGTPPTAPTAAPPTAAPPTGTPPTGTPPTAAPPTASPPTDTPRHPQPPAAAPAHANPPATPTASGPTADPQPAAPIDPRAGSHPGPAGRRDSSSRPPRRSGSRPTRRLRRPAVLAAALLVAVAVVAGLRARAEPPPTVERPRLVAEALSTVGVRDTAGLADPTRRAGCLRTVGAPVESPEAPLLGGRRVTFEGAEGVLLVLGTGRRGAFDVLIVDPDCGPESGKLLTATRVTPP